MSGLLRLYPIAILFLYLFAFRLPGVYNSSVLATLVCAAHVALRPARIRELLAVYRSTAYLAMAATLAGFFCWSAIVSTARGAYDFSIASTAASNLFYLATAPLVVHAAFRRAWARGEGGVEPAVFWAFALQSVLILAAFLDDGVRQTVRSVQVGAQTEKAAEYYGGGLRGLALSGGIFFNLACAYCVFFVVAARRLATRREGTVAVALLPVCAFASLTVGRTAFVGMGFAALFAVVAARAAGRDARLAANLRRAAALVAAGVAAVLAAVPLERIADALDGYVRFSFEMVLNYLDGKGLSTASTEVLESMYFPVELSTFVFGDGRYTAADGSYYGETDAGYMRNLLYAGIGGLALLVAHLGVWCAYMVRYARRRRDRVGVTFALATGAMLLVLHYKGEVLGYLVSTNVLLYAMLVEAFSRDRLARRASGAPRERAAAPSLSPCVGPC